MSLMSKCNNLSANNHIFNASGAVDEMGDPWSVVLPVFQSPPVQRRIRIFEDYGIGFEDL